MEKEVVIFGSYHDEPLEWYILDKIDNKFLLVTKNIIDNIEFNNKLSSTTWEKSLIRQWLNNDFLNNTFTTEEYGHIQTTRVKTIDGVYNNVNGGNATDDKIFLLSVEEIEKYFPLLDSRICGVTDYAKNKLGHDNSWWWLRSMVNAQYTPAYINKDGKVASMSARNSYIGTRPAMWIDLSKTKDEYVKSQIEYLKIGKINNEPILWRILDKKEDKLLLVSEYGINSLRVNPTSPTPFENTELKKWLNTHFLKNFNEKEINSIIGDVSLLTYEQAINYFEDRNDRKCFVPDFVVENGGYKTSENTGFYWLATDGYGAGKMMVNGDGSINRPGISEEYKNIIRPVMWIKL